MLAIFLIPLVSAEEPAVAYQPIQGACVQTMLPAVDEPCSGANKGSFDAAGKSLKSAAECAQYVKEQCNKDGDKAVFVSYVAGEFDFNAGTGVCSWFGADQCGCYEEKSCGEPKDHAGTNVATPAYTGSISELLNEEGSGIPVQRGAEEGSTGVEVEDEAYAAAQQAMMNSEPEMPKEPQLATIASAEELDMDEVRGDPNAIKQIQEDAAEIEPACPDMEVAVLREEWQCIALPLGGGLQMGSLMGFVLGSVASGAVAAGFTHAAGKRMRKKAGGDDDPMADAALSGAESDA